MKHNKKNRSCPQNQSFDGEPGKACICGLEKEYYDAINGVAQPKLTHRGRGNGPR